MPSCEDLGLPVVSLSGSNVRTYISGYTHVCTHAQRCHLVTVMHRFDVHI